MMHPGSRNASLKWLRRDIGPHGGDVAELHDYGDKRLLIIVQDVKFRNMEAASNIAAILTELIKRRLVRLVATEAAWGDVDTSWISRSVDSETGRPKAVDTKTTTQIATTLFNASQLSSAEYVHILLASSYSFELFGAENESLYEKAAALWAKSEPLWSFINAAPSPERVSEASRKPELAVSFEAMQAFLDNERARSEAIFRNTLARMSELRVNVAVIICRGNVPDSLVAKAKAESVSYATVKIRTSTAEDVEGFLDVQESE